MMIPRPDIVDDELQINRRTGILEECVLGKLAGTKALACRSTGCGWVAVRNPGVAADREKFAIASRHGNIGVNYNSEAKPNMSKIVIVYSQPG
jgi:hypothetical protein